MKLAKSDLIAALRLRYDHYSASTVFEAACARAGLADQPEYAAAEIAAFRTALAAVGDRLANVEIRIEALLEDARGTAPAAPAPTPAAPAATAAAPVPTPAAPAAAPVAPATTIEARADAPHEAEPAAPATIETIVALSGVEVDDGEQLMMCGGFAALGDWDPARACEMSRNGDLWLATLTLAPGAEVAFKFFRRAADGTVVWERGENRSLVAKPRIEASWR